MTDLTAEVLARHHIRPQTIIDVGAYDCYSSQLFRDWFPGATVVSIEASLRNYVDKCLRNCAGLRLFHLAIGAENGVCLFHDSDGAYQGSGSILAPNLDLLLASYPGMRFDQSYPVPCLRLDEFCRRTHLFPDFVHIDAQGADLIVAQSLGDLRPEAIFLETSGCGEYVGAPACPEEITAALEAMGYRLAEQLPADALFVLRR